MVDNVEVFQEKSIFGNKTIFLGISDLFNCKSFQAISTFQ